MTPRPQQNLRYFLAQLREIHPPGRTIRLMEVCGTHTVALFRSGVKSLLPEWVRLISGPGCPVCVTSQGYIDVACALARRPEVIICTYGDMVRVPGKQTSLEHQRSRGAAVEVVYSARDALLRAHREPDRKVVFLAVGFETTTPATAAAGLEARQRGIGNFFLLPGHKLVIPALKALLSSEDVPLAGFICPGHVSVVIGARAYETIARDYGKPCVITGFEPPQLLQGILHLVRQVTRHRSEVENVYPVVVSHEGNPHARGLIEKVFEPADTVWRAMGTIPLSGLELRASYRQYDAFEHFGMQLPPDEEPVGCLCGSVIQGKVDPPACSLFGRKCTPTHPVGPCMVSSEGTCAAWFKYHHAVAGEKIATEGETA